MNKSRILMGLTVLALAVVMAACNSGEPAPEANGGTTGGTAQATTGGAPKGNTTDPAKPATGVSKDTLTPTGNAPTKTTSG